MKLNASQIAELRAALDERGGAADFARKYGLHPPTVRRWAKELGLGSKERTRIRQVEAVGADAERLRREIPPDTRDLTARMFGDPLVGRRALDMRARDSVQTVQFDARVRSGQAGAPSVGSGIS